jgi:hypothetical protein
MQIEEKESLDLPKRLSGQPIKDKKAKKSSRFLLDVESDNTFPAFVMGILIFNIVLTILFGALAIAFVRLSMRPVPTLVQLADGEVLRTHPTGHLVVCQFCFEE